MNWQYDEARMIEARRWAEEVCAKPNPQALALFLEELKKVPYHSLALS
jgi:hypothetical protein